MLPTSEKSFFQTQWYLEEPSVARYMTRALDAGKQMNDDKPVTEYGIEGGSVLHLVIALRGGCA